MKRTAEEVGKSFDCLLNFLEFTTETQEDFESNWLPTLDFQTTTLPAGRINFKFFSKPMQNNMCIQKGSALPRNIIFSALRQEVVRRLSNCSPNTDDATKIEVVEDFIQVMSNSGHQYPFIKSVVLQGITKYKSLLIRSRLDADSPKFKPLYRARSYRTAERLLQKYVEDMTWYKDKNLGDLYKNEWKRKIVTKEKHYWRSMKKSSKHGGNDQLRNSGRDKEVTTTFFTPPSNESKLLDMILEAEEDLTKDSPWRVKVVEQSGTPLMMSLMNKTPIREGCVKGEQCLVCENTGIKCAPKGVIYRATCLSCKNSHGPAGMYCYIGETSRPFRERVAEHLTNVENWKPTSFWIAHWMDHHSTDTIRPEFKFEVVSQYPDPLRRQLAEALEIMDTGNLNKRLEFNSNELCRMESKLFGHDLEQYILREQAEKRDFKQKVDCFIKVMSRAIKNQSESEILFQDKRNKSELDTATNPICCFRSKIKKKRSETGLEEPLLQSPNREEEPPRKRRMMTSTPKLNASAWRSKVTHHSDSDDNVTGTEQLSKSWGDGFNLMGLQEEPGKRATAQEDIAASLLVKSLLVTPPKPETSSMEERAWTVETRNLYKSAKRAMSLPSLSDSSLDIEDNWFRRSRTRANSWGFLGDLSMNTWEESMEVDDWINGIETDIFTLVGPGQLGTRETDAKQTEAVMSSQMMAPQSPVEQDKESVVAEQALCDSATFPQGRSVVAERSTTGKPKLASVEAMCQTPVRKEIEQMVNKKPSRLSAVFLGLGMDQKILNQPASPHATPVKRSLIISPGDETDKSRKYSTGETASPILRRPSTASVIGAPKPRINRIAANFTGKKKRKKGQRDKNQPLINEVLNNIVPAGKAKEDGFDSKDKGGETGDNKDKTNSSNTDES